MLPAVAQVEVVEARDLRLALNERVFDVAGVGGFGVDAEGFLWLGARPTPVNFQIENGFKLLVLVAVEKLHTRLSRPGLPKITSEIRVVGAGIWPHDINARVPIPEVVFVGNDGDDRQVVIVLVDDVGAVDGRAGERLAVIAKRFHTEHSGLAHINRATYDRIVLIGFITVGGIMAGGIGGGRHTNGVAGAVPSRGQVYNRRWGYAGIASALVVRSIGGRAIEKAPTSRTVRRSSSANVRTKPLRYGNAINDNFVGVADNYGFPCGQFKTGVRQYHRWREPRRDILVLILGRSQSGG